MAITREIDITEAYSTWTPQEFALLYIEMYGQIDGGHHKQWVLDQVTRILLGTPVTVKLAKWDNGQQSEPRFSTGEPSQKYLDWVKRQLGEGNDEDGYEYGYDEGSRE